MPRTSIGIDIGTSAIRAVEVRLGKQPSIRSMARIDLRPGTVEHGIVNDADSFAVSLAELWASGRFKGRKVHLGIGSSSTVIREHAVPGGTHADIRSSLPLYVEGALPFDAADAILDFYGTGDDGDRRAGLLVAATRADIDSNLLAVEAAGLEVESIDVLPFALWRAAGNASGVAGLLDFGASATTIVIARDGRPEFVRVVPTGGSDLTVTVSRELRLEASAAEDAKRNGHLSKPTHSEDERALQATLRNGARELLTAIRDTLHFIDASRAGLSPTILHVTGCASLLGGLIEALGESTGLEVVPVRRLRGAGSVDSTKLAAPDTGAREFAGAFGIAAAGGRS